MKLSEKYFEKYIHKNIYGNTGFPQGEEKIKTYGIICYIEGLMNGSPVSSPNKHECQEHLNRIAKENNL